MKQKVIAPQKPLKPAVQPLRWGTWPTHEMPIEIAGLRGKWAFIQPWACGSWEAVLVVPWKERRSEQAPRQVVAAADVRVPAALNQKVRVVKHRQSA